MHPVVGVHEPESRCASYLDHAATSWPKPPGVIEAVVEGMTECASPGRSAHRLGLDASRRIHEARSAAASFLGVDDPRDLIFGAGATYLLNMVLKGSLASGDRVVASGVEHNSVARPLAWLQARGVAVDYVMPDAEGVLDPDDFEEAVKAAPTRAVVCQHASNVTGAIQPIADLADIAHDAGALMFVDGCQAAGHLALSLSKLGADAYVMSGHKALLGPQGVGLAYLAPSFEPVEMVQGGTGGTSESIEQPTVKPERYESGTSNTPGIAGLGAAVSYLAHNAEDLRLHEQAMLRLLFKGVAALPGFRVLGPPLGVPRVPLITVTHESVEANRLAFLLDKTWGVASRAGLHCAPAAHRALGTLSSGGLRLSVGWCTSEEDVELGLRALEAASAG